MTVTRRRWRPFAYIAISAILFGASAPLAKILVVDLTPLALAGLLYLGAFVGLFLSASGSRLLSRQSAGREPLKRADYPYLAGAILSGGVIAPVLLLTGLTTVTGYASSLLLNLEGVATAFIALLVFRERVGRRTWTALALMTAAGALLTLDPEVGGTSLFGALMIVLAMAFWGLDNNLTRQISDHDPRQIAMLKGLVAGTVSLSAAFLLGQGPALSANLFLALILGALSYGISLVLFIIALDSLGSARTGAFFSVGPFVGAALSIPLLNESPELAMLPAAVLMAIGVFLLLTERHSHLHRHERLVHSHAHTRDEGHLHEHPAGTTEPHTHEHVHEERVHEHDHLPDTDHRHQH